MTTGARLSCVSPVVWGAPHLESGDGDVDFDVLGLARTNVNLEVMVVRSTLAFETEGGDGLKTRHADLCGDHPS